MNQLVKKLITTAASGAAIAYYTTTKKGREVAEKTKALYDDYKANPDRYRQLVTDSVRDYKTLAVETFKGYKDKFEADEVTDSESAETVTKAETSEESDETTVIITLPDVDGDH